MAFFKKMNIYIYSDESGVFDHLNNDYFVFGGIICFGTKEKDSWCRKYSHVESVIRKSGNYDKDYELKASKITNAEKGKIFRSLNNAFKFCVLIKEKELLAQIFENKKHKQRYLDFAFKIVLKKCFNLLIKTKILNPDDVDYIYVNVDEHNTATDGKYELRENLLNEFKCGTFNFELDHFYDPIFPKIKDVVVEFCDSSKTRLVRAADIIANNCWVSAMKNNGIVEGKSNLYVYVLPQKIVSSNGLEYFSNRTLTKDTK